MVTIKEMEEACEENYGIDVNIDEVIHDNKKYWKFSIFDYDADGFIGIAELDLQNFNLEGFFGGRIELGKMICDGCAFSKYEDILNKHENFSNSPENAVDIILNNLTAEQILEEIMDCIRDEIKEYISWSNMVLDTLDYDCY